MGALFRVGLGELSLEEFLSSLLGVRENFVKFQAPAPGLILHKTQLK